MKSMILAAVAAIISCGLVSANSEDALEKRAVHCDIACRAGYVFKPPCSCVPIAICNRECTLGYILQPPCQCVPDPNNPPVPKRELLPEPVAKREADPAVAKRICQIICVEDGYIFKPPCSCVPDPNNPLNAKITAKRELLPEPVAKREADPAVAKREPASAICDIACGDGYVFKAPCSCVPVAICDRECPVGYTLVPPCKCLKKPIFQCDIACLDGYTFKPPCSCVPFNVAKRDPAESICAIRCPEGYTLEPPCQCVVSPPAICQIACPVGYRTKWPCGCVKNVPCNIKCPLNSSFAPPCGCTGPITA